MHRTRWLEWFDEVFKSKGWTVSGGCKQKPGFRKIALFCDPGGVPSHAAKQVEGSWWESKLGPSYRIVHLGLRSLEGTAYGKVCRCYEKDLQSVLADLEAILEDVRRRMQSGENHHLGTAERELEEQIRSHRKSIELEVRD